MKGREVGAAEMSAVGDMVAVAVGLSMVVGVGGRCVGVLVAAATAWVAVGAGKVVGGAVVGGMAVGMAVGAAGASWQALKNISNKIRLIHLVGIFIRLPSRPFIVLELCCKRVVLAYILSIYEDVVHVEGKGGTGDEMAGAPGGRHACQLRYGQHVFLFHVFGTIFSSPGSYSR